MTLKGSGLAAAATCIRLYGRTHEKFIRAVKKPVGEKAPRGSVETTLFLLQSPARVLVWLGRLI